MGTFESEAVEARLHDRLAEVVKELAEARRQLERIGELVADFREGNARLQRALNSLARISGEPVGLRPVPDREPEMAVWNAAEAEKR